ncbi:alpha/beta hydrolase [Saccharothrix sp. BKS2]|uniref:alpha/beta hydrolase n=1 Tax=Saccharothrix sp. BKS2 TaxID=3064400 RepID=UPI0039E9C542
MSLPHVLVLPGLGGAGPAHWQNWPAGEPARHGGSVDVPEFSAPEFSAPDAPRLDVWLDELRGHLAAARVSSAHERVVVTHSLACLLRLHHAAGEFDGAGGSTGCSWSTRTPPASPSPGGFPHPVPDPAHAAPTRRCRADPAVRQGSGTSPVGAGTAAGQRGTRRPRNRMTSGTTLR